MTAERLRDRETGRFIKTECPDLNCDGHLEYEGDYFSRCNGLVDPNDETKELQACEYSRYPVSP